jgi:ABC-type branched-subunit amino acid transport system permease subunit
MTSYLIAMLALVAISTLVGLGLNIQWGLCGLVNFGVAGFFALGAYVAALVGLAGGGAWGGLAAAALAGALSSALLALLAARLEDDYLAIVTIGFGEIVRLVMLNEGWLTGGALGLSDIPRPFSALAGSSYYPLLFLGVATVVLACVLAILEALARSPFGRALRAVRDDDVVAATLGKRPLLLRIKAFAIGGAVIGIAGALHAFYMTYIDPSQFTPILTAYAFMAVIAGGRGSNLGLLLGAGSIMLLLEATRFLKDVIPLLDGTRLAAFRLAMIGVGIILLMILRPQGLFREPRLETRHVLPPAARPIPQEETAT